MSLPVKNIPKGFLVLNERSRILQRMLQGRVMQAYEFFPSRAVDSDLIITCLAVFFLLPLKSNRSSVSNTSGHIKHCRLNSFFFPKSFVSFLRLTLTQVLPSLLKGNEKGLQRGIVWERPLPTI